VSYTVIEELAIVPTSLAHLMSTIEEGTYRIHGEGSELELNISCFSDVPKPGDALLIGLSAAVPSCAVTLQFDCDIALGHGVDPRDPPIVWEAFDGETWAACEVGRDDTGGLNRPGSVVLHVPRNHLVATIENHRAGWIRCRVVEARAGQPVYGGSPEIKQIVAVTSGGTARTVNADVIEGEVLGLSNGLSGQRFALKNGPVIESDEPAEIEVESDDELWTEVDDFDDSGHDDRHFVIDRAAGEVVFGPVVREPEGGLTYHGAVPRAKAQIRIRSYSTGGGGKGNVAAGAIKMLKTSLPRIARVENRAAAAGGTDGEDLTSAKQRAPMAFRGTRAVAAKDFEHQAREAAPNEVGRVLCLPAGDGSDPGAVRVVVTPAVKGDETGKLRFEDVEQLREPLLDKIAERLESRRVVGVRVLVEPALYKGMTVEATVHAEPRSDPKLVQAAGTAALYRYFHPIIGGPDGQGWPFGRPVHVGEAFAVLQTVPGVRFVEEARLYPINPKTGERGEEVEKLDLDPDALVFSFDHAVEVVYEGSS
jgi:predicted phage baseplate assembly protein